MANQGLQDRVNSINALRSAQENFLSSLPTKEKQGFVPCATVNDLVQELQKLDIVAREGSSGKRWLSIVRRFAERLEPYFKIVDIFVSSNPQYAAIFWGSLRLVLKLAENYTTFFEKLSRMLSTLADSLPQYDELLRLCHKKSGTSEDEANPHRMPNHIEQIYEDIFRAFHIAASIFTKSDGSAKRPSLVAASLIWKPFEARFADILDRMAEHRRFVFQQLIIWHASESAKETAKAAAERDLAEAEREDAAQERRLAEEERTLRQEQRDMDEKAAQNASERFAYMQDQIIALENRRKDDALQKIQRWIAAPSYVSHYEQARHIRAEGTARWLFEEEAYQHWLHRKAQTVAQQRRFGSQVLWIQGHPGAGKTVLAAAVLEELMQNEGLASPSPSTVYYYFFDHQSPMHCQTSYAYRSIVWQMVWEYRRDAHLLDRLTFILDETSTGQLTATDAELLDILRLCLTPDTILVFDGIDECSDSESLVRSLVKLSQDLPDLRHLLLSRINVPILKLSVPTPQIFTMPKAKLSPDIYRFLLAELEDLFEDQLLPEASIDEKDALAERLCQGADGMFLWARLMVRCLGSPYLTKQYRLRMISEVNLPEGLEKIYERIVRAIHESGSHAASLASKALTWLAFSVAPMTMRQLRQAFTAQDDTALPPSEEDILEFQDCVVMTCAGLVEPSKIDPNAECLRAEPALQFIHLSLQELIAHQLVSNESWPGQQVWKERGGDVALKPIHSLSPGNGSRDTAPVFQPLVAMPATANLAMAACCLRQLLYYTPAQPLGAAFNARVSEAALYREHCFTSYAAVHWIGHLQSFLKSTAHMPSLVQTEVAGVMKYLSTFLSRPRVLSAWLEAYYIARYQRDTAGYHHPPFFVVHEWVDAVATSCLDQQQPWMRTIIQEMQETVRAFMADLEMIIGTWGSQLDQSPEIIWDEMTYYAKTRLFFAPQSVRVSVQEPQPPDYPNLSTDPIARMSKTSASGDTKGVLCVWAPREIHDKRVFTTLRVMNRDRRTDIQPLCTGWIATYHIWTLEKPDAPAGRVEIPLHAEDVLLPLRQYLDYPISDGIDFPLAIGPDAAAFCILRTVYVIRWRKEPRRTNILSYRLSEATPFDPDFLWGALGGNSRAVPSFYNFYFAAGGTYLALYEFDEGGCTLTVFKYFHDLNTGLVLDKVNELQISRQIDKLEHLTFHPSRSLLAFCGRKESVSFGKDNVLFLWHFQSRNGQSLMYQDLARYWNPMSVAFSSCGEYLVVHRDFPQNAEPLVIPCPRTGFHSQGEGTFITEESLTSIQTGHASGSLTRTISGSPPPSEAKPGPPQLAKLDPSTMLTEVSQSMTGAQVSLLQKSADDIATTKIVTLPHSVQFEGAVHTALPPRSRDDSFKVSVDMDRRRHYSLIEGPNNAHATVIERHPAFVSTSSSRTPRVIALTPGPRTGDSVDSLDFGQEWRVYPRDIRGERLYCSLLDPGYVPRNCAARSITDQSKVQDHQEDTSRLGALALPQQLRLANIVHTMFSVPIAALSWLVPRKP